MSPIDLTPPDRFRLRGPGAPVFRRVLLVLAIAFTLLVGIFLISREARLHFIYTYLVAFMFWLTIGVGALFFVMLQHLTGARWSIVIRRLAEQLAMLLPLMLLLLLPILAGLPWLYPWVNAHAVGPDRLLQGKHSYLNVPFFVIRALVYFGVWIGLAWIMISRSLRQDVTGDPALGESMRRWSAPGMILFAVTLTFASFDWVMSLDPHWYSTIFGIYIFAGALVAIFSTLILIGIAARGTAVLGARLTLDHFHDLGKLLFGFVIFWAYIAFSQFLLIWMGNIPEETVWYLHRWASPGWRAISYVLLFGHFILPFIFLLPRSNKRNRFTLGLAALWLLAMHYLDLYWLIMPNLSHVRVPWHAIDLFLPLAMGCLFFWCYLYRLERQPMIPMRDPHLAESIAFENV